MVSEVESGLEEPGKRQNGARGGAWDKEAKEEEPEASGATLSFFDHLFDLVKILFFREAILDSG